MTGKFNGRQVARERRADKFGLKSISDAFVQARKELGDGPRRASRRLVVITERTVHNWIAQKTEPSVAAILNVPEYAEAFARCLLVAVKKRMRAERRGGR